MAKTLNYLFILFVSMVIGLPAKAAILNNADATLESISYSTLPGDLVQIRLSMSGNIKEPGSFTIDNPARIALDFPKTKSNLPRKNKSIGVGVTRSVTTVEAGGRTRVVINLTKLVGYQTKIEGSDVIVTINSTGSQEIASNSIEATPLTSSGTVVGKSINNVDFRRGEKGEGRIIVTLSDPNTAVDMSKQGKQVYVTLQNTKLPDELQRRLDVIDFATPVRTVDAFQQGADVRMVIAAQGNYDHIAYQTDNRFTIDIKTVSKEEEQKKKQNKFGYSGERLSLNFQNIEVRAVLQLIADFTGINMVTSDAVSGTLTLRLKNVPWDQALDIILKTKGLAKRQAGNVMMIGPASEIAAQEKIELEASKQIEELAPLINDNIQVNYAKAEEIAGLIKSASSSMLSERGSINIDNRTNKLLVHDIEERVTSIRKLVAELDVPVKQVLIESRIVIANDDFSKDLGVRFGVTDYDQEGGDFKSTSGNATGTGGMVNDHVGGGAIGFPSTNNRMNVDLPVNNQSAGSIALAILNGNTLVDLELSALQLEGKGKIVSNPRVVTANGHKAMIEQGVEIPYQEASSSGATSVSFKKAVLSLEVTPQITPDNRVIMDLQVNKDSVGQIFFGVPSIDTREVQTQVLVSNGETIVLGGVYEQIKSSEVDRVPFFGDLPLIGALFRQTRERDEKSELLIFVTPKILKDIKVF
ncbi:MAG: type IV pilus secretin PilQ [Gammaproteobacteria bacterium]|nr:type IV pilus secretin PilQ [Gammaproteobacteria bacterium]